MMELKSVILKEAKMLNYLDNGCEKATKLQGSPSLCLECPFHECIEIIGLCRHYAKERDEQIVRLGKEGLNASEISKVLRISKGTVRKALNDKARSCSQQKE